MGIVIFKKIFNSNSHSHSFNFFLGIVIPIPILILELGFHESTTELGQLLISDIFYFLKNEKKIQKIKNFFKNLKKKSDI
jgi:hypothetical protein